MRTIQAQLITDTVAALCIQANLKLPVAVNISCHVTRRATASL